MLGKKERRWEEVVEEKKNAEGKRQSLERDDERDVFVEEKRCCQGTGKQQD